MRKSIFVIILDLAIMCIDTSGFEIVFNTVLKYKSTIIFTHKIIDINCTWYRVKREWLISPGCLRSHRGVSLCRLFHWRWTFVCKLALRPPSHCTYSHGWTDKNWDEQQVTGADGNEHLSQYIENYFRYGYIMLTRSVCQTGQYIMLH